MKASIKYICEVAEIIEGVIAGEQVITGPYDLVSKNLKEGQTVKVVDKKKLFDK